MFHDLIDLCSDLGTRINQAVEDALDALPGGSIRIAPYDLATGKPEDLDTSTGVVIRDEKHGFGVS